MRYAILFALLALSACGCSVYTARLKGEDVEVVATTSPVAVEASGKNMTGEITKDGKPFLSLPGQPFTGKVRWQEGAGWTVERQP